MCWAILAFPETPPSFRRGLMAIAREEVRHMGLYLEHLGVLGHAVGDFEVRDWFWERVPSCESPAAFVATMGIGFEGGNLDHSERFAARLHGAFRDGSGNPDPHDRMVRALWETIYGRPTFVARVELLLAARNLPEVLELTRAELLRGHGLVHDFWREAFASIGLPCEVARNHVDFALMSLRGLALEQFVRQDPPFVGRALGMLADAMRTMMAEPKAKG